LGVRILTEAGNFSFHYRVHTGFGAHPASYPMGTRGSFPRGKAAGADHSSPPSAEVKNAWSYTTIPQYSLMACCSLRAQEYPYLLLLPLICIFASLTELIKCSIIFFHILWICILLSLNLVHLISVLHKKILKSPAALLLYAAGRPALRLLFPLNTNSP
jgi:hypothetical protein